MVLFIVLIFVWVDCQAEQSIMGVNGAIIGNLNWIQIILSLVIGTILGFILALALIKRER